LFLGIQNWPLMLAVFLGLPVKRPVLIRLRNGLSYYARSAMDIWVIKEAVLDRDYERLGVPLQDGWTVFDIGAGLGDFTIATAHQHPTSRVYGFEPFPESFALLCENLSLNKVNNVQVFPHAIGGSAGTLHLKTGTGVAVKHSTAQTISDPGSVAVESKTLAQVFADLGITSCDFLKMDCEGAEYDILMKCAPETLQRILHICMEYHNGITEFSGEQLANFLRQHGFSVWLTPNPVHAEIGFLYAARGA
jgi:FkbM family methyltransferase